MTYKVLEDYSDEEILLLFVQDCFVAPGTGQVIPDFVVQQLLKMYCAQLSRPVPTKAKLTNIMRKYYTQTTKDQQTCYRAAIRPGLIQEEL